jgi:hypothetical protein
MPRRVVVTRPGRYQCPKRPAQLPGPGPGDSNGNNATLTKQGRALPLRLPIAAWFCNGWALSGFRLSLALCLVMAPAVSCRCQFPNPLPSARYWVSSSFSSFSRHTRTACWPSSSPPTATATAAWNVAGGPGRAAAVDAAWCAMPPCPAPVGRRLRPVCRGAEPVRCLPATRPPRSWPPASPGARSSPTFPCSPRRPNAGTLAARFCPRCLNARRLLLPKSAEVRFRGKALAAFPAAGFRLPCFKMTSMCLSH